MLSVPLNKESSSLVYRLVLVHHTHAVQAYNLSSKLPT